MSRARPARRRFEPLVKAVEKAGGRVLEVDFTGGSHIRLTCSFNGIVRRIIGPSTPSDGRAYLNFASDVRRIARNVVGEAMA